MEHRYDHVIAFAVEHPWALTPEMCDVVATVLARRLAGIATDPATVAAAIVTRESRPVVTPRSDAVAVIPIHGVIAPRMNLFSELSGGATFESLTADLRAAVAEQPSAIILDIDSPGGNVAGATEFAHEVLKARTQVPIIAQANHLMASAAYWIGACATDVVASPSALVGSVGVYTIYDDMSAALEQLGIKRDVISAGKFKGEGVDRGPLSVEARAHRQALVTYAYDRFLADISLGRGVTVDRAQQTFGEGRVLCADDAVAAGMVSRIATMDDTLDRYLSGTTPAPVSRAATANQVDHAAFLREQLALAQLHAECV